MNSWLIYDKQGYARNKWFARQLTEHTGAKLIISEHLKYGTADKIYFEYEGKKLSAPDFAIQRAILPLLSYTLEACGTRVFNSARVCDICNDKRKTHLFASTLGIPSVSSVFWDSSTLPDFALPYPVIVKSAAGHGGSEVFMANDKTELAQAAKKISDSRLLIQKCVSDKGTDKRVYLLGGKVLAAVERHAQSGFKSNFSLGGKAVLSTVTAEENEIINKITSALTPDFVGIDFIYNNGKPLLNEIEDIVGTRMLYELTDLDAAKLYSQYILKITENKNV